MKFSAVAFALAAAVGVSASYSGNATVVTEVVDVYTTYCPGPTELTYGTKTYTVTKVLFFFFPPRGITSTAQSEGKICLTPGCE